MPTLEAVRQIIRTEIRPLAAAMDVSAEALRAGLDVLARHRLLALKRPAAFGGPAWAETDFRRFQEEIARASGALAFLQTQHQSAVSLLGKHASESMKKRLLPCTDGGELMIGVGFSQLRRAGDPICTAIKTSSGYLVNGQVPWITGYGIFHQYLLGAALPDGRSLFALVRFENLPGQTLSPPMRLAAMETCQTVSAQLNDLEIGDDQVAFIKEANWIRANDAFNITLQGHFAIGCALAGLELLSENAEQKQFEFLRETHHRLSDEVRKCQSALDSMQTETSPESAPERLKLRGWAIDLMFRCAQAAVVSSSGAANSADHPAQRIYREAIVFSVSAQTADIMAQTVNRLTREG